MPPASAAAIGAGAASGGSALAAWMPAISAGIGGGLSFLGQSSANSKNWKIAKKQMEFQERMYDSRYQKTMADLRAAGLNPILAGQLVGATPGGASAQMQNALGAGVSSAMQAARVKQELDLLREQTRDQKAKADISESDAYYAKLKENAGRGIDLEYQTARLARASRMGLDRLTNTGEAITHALGEGDVLGAARELPGPMAFGGVNAQKLIDYLQTNEWYQKYEAAVRKGPGAVAKVVGENLRALNNARKADDSISWDKGFQKVVKDLNAKFHKAMQELERRQ